MNSMTPFSASGARRIRSSERPCVPHGLNESIALTWPFLSIASTSTQRPSAGSPSRPSAIEKPRSVSVSRQAVASRDSSFISSSGMSACRRTVAV